MVGQAGDEVTDSREILLALTGRLPEPYDQAVFIPAVLVTDAILDTVYAVKEVALLPLRVFGAIK